MPDLDELLATDAHASAGADGSPSAFAPAFDRTMTRIRRRRVGAALGAGAVAAALTGGVLISTAGPSDSPQRVRLAAYEHAVAPVPGRPDYSYVVAPASGRLAHECRLVAGASVTVHESRYSTGPSAGAGGGALVSFGTGGNRLPAEIRQLVITVAAARGFSGHYALFTCRTR